MARKQRKRTNANVPAKGRLQEMADLLWSLAVRSDWAGKCAACGARKCEAHHLIPRQHNAMRYRLQNGIALCAVCHKFDKDTSPHQNAAGWLQWLAEHHFDLHQWYTTIVESGEHREFEDTTNADYYCKIILWLKEYVDEDDYRLIVGKKFAAYLDSQE